MSVLYRDRLTEDRFVVFALSQANPIVEANHERFWSLCRAGESFVDESGQRVARDGVWTVVHEDDCPWLRAYKLVVEPDPEPVPEPEGLEITTIPRLVGGLDGLEVRVVSGGRHVRLEPGRVS